MDWDTEAARASQAEEEASSVDPLDSLEQVTDPGRERRGGRVNSGDS